MRPSKAFTPIWLDQLENRLALSTLGVHYAPHVGHHGHHGHAAHVAHHRHAAHIHSHPSGSVLPGAGTTSSASATNPTTPPTDPTAPVTAPTAPTTSPTTPATSPPTPGTGPTVAALVLSGQVEGHQPLDGSGNVGPLGAVTSTGTLSASGAEPMNYSGTVTLVGSSGSVTLSLTGRLFGPVSIGRPVDLTYTITGGTGAFEDATGSGNAVLSFHLPSGTFPNPSPAPNSFVLAFA
jgi:hypothetical protein